MKEYRVTEKQLEKLSLYLEELSGVHKDMMGDDGCVNLRDLILSEVKSQPLEDADYAR